MGSYGIFPWRIHEVRSHEPTKIPVLNWCNTSQWGMSFLIDGDGISDIRTCQPNITSRWLVLGFTHLVFFKLDIENVIYDMAFSQGQLNSLSHHNNWDSKEDISSTSSTKKHPDIPTQSYPAVVKHLKVGQHIPVILERRNRWIFEELVHCWVQMKFSCCCFFV